MNGNIIFLILVLISWVGLYKLFMKAGEAGWKAFVPVYNFVVASKLINRTWWWALIMIIPGVNLIMYGVYGFHLARAFGKRSTNDLWFAALLPYIFLPMIGFDEKVKYVGTKDIKKESGFIKNWLDPIIFAIVAASIIRTFLLEAFTIPTSSLEKSLMVGDFLFVNKLSYGAKIPQTPVSFPFAHNILPLTKTTKSYLEFLKLPYMRLPGYSKIKNGDIVVFNYPDGDTVAMGAANMSYYQLVREVAANTKMQNPQLSDAAAMSSAWNYVNSPQEPFGKVIARPADKRDHYVKRCVGIAGDKVEVRDGSVYINGTKQAMPENAQHYYYVKMYREPITVPTLDKMDIYVEEAAYLTTDQYGNPSWYYFSGRYDGYDKNPQDIQSLLKSDTTLYMLNLTAAKAETFKSMPGCVSVQIRNEVKGDYDPRVFPHNPGYAWNNDNFGPFVLPKEGTTVKIDTGNICLYEKMLSTYDDGMHSIEKRNGQVLYDGQPMTSYTFKQDYYWMMGDNRHNSADSRSWGVVPFDHVVGKPVFVWFSMKDAEKNPVSGKSAFGSLFKNSQDGKFRWNRFLCYVGDNGLVSWRIPILILVIALIGYSQWNKRRKKKTTTTSTTK